MINLKVEIDSFINLNEPCFRDLIKYGLYNVEAAAIRMYTNEGKEIIDFNRRLREGTEIQEDLTLRGLLNSALKKLGGSFNFLGEVYRGITVNSKNVKFFVDKHFSQKIIFYEQFVSTTKNSEVCYFGNTRYRIQSKTGVDISSFSVNKFEEEVLFKAKTGFYITQFGYKCNEGYDTEFVLNKLNEGGIKTLYENDEIRNLLDKGSLKLYIDLSEI
jgi:hypothetical protein